jgi:hypothetical protein
MLSIVCDHAAGVGATMWNGSWPWSAKLTDLLTTLADCPKALGEHPRLIKPRMISRRIKSARLRREINRADRLRRERRGGRQGFP